MTTATLEAPAINRPATKPASQVRYANRGTTTYVLDGIRFTPPRNVSLMDYVVAQGHSFNSKKVRRLYGTSR